MIESEQHSLPSGWCLCQLSELIGPDGVFSDGDWIESKDQDPNGDVRLVQLADIGQIRFLDKSNRFLTREKADALNCTYLRPEDVLISRLGDPLGKACIYPGNEPYAVTAVDVCIFRPAHPQVIEPTLIAYFLNSITAKVEIDAHASGTTRKRITGKKLKAIRFPLPPLKEQRRIVEKIETLFSQLDKGEEAIRTVQALLKRYRQSVLKAAATGALTADWRAENAGRLEHGRDLLTRILKTRRETWSGRGKYKEPMAPDTSDLPELPEGWIWASVDQILKSPLSNGRSVPDADNGFPVLRLTALKNDVIDVFERKTGAWDAQSAKPFLVEEGDILVSRGNGSRRLVGRGSLVEAVPEPVAYPDTMIRVPIQRDFVNPKWFVQIWNSPLMRDQIESSARTTAGIHKINQTDIRGFRLPLPSLQEQEHISETIGKLLGDTVVVEDACTRELIRFLSLRQSILKDAFAGRLVPQDPTEEPASDLLARIKAEQADRPRKVRNRRKKQAAA